MASYNLKFNKDDSVVRHLIIGLLSDLNDKLSFFRQISNDERVIVDVPFFYSITGDENFLRDSFLFSTINGVGCDPDLDKADGNYDKVPRGLVNLTSLNVDPSKLVNKRNMGHYSRLDANGEMQGFVSEFEMIPVVIGMDVELLLSSQLDLFKVTEAIVKKMYKSNYYNVEVGHIEEGLYRLAAYYAMPDDYTIERPIEYGFDDKGNHKVTFSLEVNSFIPSFDYSTERHVGNRMFTLGGGTPLGTGGNVLDDELIGQTEDGKNLVGGLTTRVTTLNDVEEEQLPPVGENYRVKSTRLPFDKKNYFG
jgi:hypothetical protein